MRLPCPCCGLRDRREFTYYGAADFLARPAADAQASTGTADTVVSIVNCPSTRVPT